MFQLSEERLRLFEEAGRELRGEIDVYNLGQSFKEFHHLSSSYNQVYCIDFRRTRGCHYGASNVFVEIIRQLEENGVKVGNEIHEVNPDTTRFVETSTGNAAEAFVMATNKLGYTGTIVIMPDGLPEARYKNLEKYGAEVVRTKKELYVRGLPLELKKYIKKNKERKPGEKLSVISNHSVGAIEITFSRMKTAIVEQFPKKYDGPSNPNTLTVTFGNGASINALSEALKAMYSNLKVVGTADFAYGGGYNIFAQQKGLPLYEELYGILNGALSSDFSMIGSDFFMGIELPFQKRAFEKKLIDEFVLCTNKTILEAFRKTNPTSEQWKNAKRLPQWDTASPALIRSFGNTSLANIMTAAQNLRPGEIALATVYDDARLYLD
jgi:cysteine synthase